MEKHLNTAAEAVEFILSTLTDTQKEQIKRLTLEELHNLHFGLGTDIRNKLGLWDDNCKLLISHEEIEPDDASMLIINEVWRRCREEPY